MIDRVEFETDEGVILPERYGMILKSFSAPPPQPKIYRESIDGADGDVDMSEWAGEIRFASRVVEVVLRDMTGQKHQRFINLINGRRVKIRNSAMPGFYFSGRCEKTTVEASRRVTDVTMRFTCDPYRLASIPTVVSKAVTDTVTLMLSAEQKSVIPEITVDAQFTMDFDNRVYILPPGTYKLPSVVITKSMSECVLSGTGNVTFRWQDGVM